MDRTSDTSLSRRSARASTDSHEQPPRPASANLAHLNDLLGDISNSHLQFDAANVGAAEDDDDDYGGYESEEDYALPEEAIASIAGASDVPREVILQVWRSQRGVCPVSQLPIDLASLGLYGGTLAPDCFSHPISEHNARIVLRGIGRMRDATGLPWSAFAAFLSRVHSDVPS